uniref:Enoyl reductase (ER) domain-containing protein n=1 Tax=Chromera velia CCMP2878 TaxID=1169474 RepID=A0A0G4HHL5_9ALVE|eukprot:Cvel_27526.t1-p1 / transcript=Cvel_27526.t1 / gene=Cvel_27526 / organism=Chromera_velia_CCMP2878 / gene_product=Quinone oxidoreductase-like protein At1g23740,, putative / transcript_product=Quinone oxidoreductase-like protein At1g23740,, putative / location=Cvel_scaffold3450:9947-11065(-) / protein_length=373 / sequence_SO=supercontig / SO=protein_coding / is_pseudo=false
MATAEGEAQSLLSDGDGEGKRMKAVVVTQFGEVDRVLEEVSDHPQPSLSGKKGEILVRVLTCSLSPGDLRRLSGATEVIMGKPNFPYVPCGDICGIVEAVAEGSAFKEGDCVVSTWDAFGMGGTGELAIVDEKYTARKPENLDIVEAVALANSASYALAGFELGCVKKGAKVLVLGASGGVGSSIVQLAKDAGAAFVAATSSDTQIVSGLGADLVVNHREENWWENQQMKSAGPFDAVFDCAEGAVGWQRAKKMMKSGCKGGKFVAFVLNEWDIQIKSALGLFTILGPPLGRHIGSSLCSCCSPKYHLVIGPDVNGESMSRVFELVKEGRLRPVVCPESPFDFTKEGVTAAFRLLESRRAHGKIVIKIAEEEY